MNYAVKQHLVDIPESWIEQTTLMFTFVGDQTDPLLPPKIEASITVRVDDAEDGLAAKTFLENQIKRLTQMIAGYKVEQQGSALDGVSGEIEFAEVSASEPVAAKQMIVVRKVGRRFITLTGSAVLAHFDDHRPTFLKAAQSIKVR